MSSQRNFGVLLGYLSLALRNILGLLLIPFIISNVGIAQYGIYTIVASLAGYLIILELGLANTTIRFLSKLQAEQNQSKEAEFFGTMLMIYGVITAIVIMIGAVLWHSLPAMFNQSLAVTEIALLQQSFAILLVNIAITLMSNSFTGVITSRERFIFQKGSEIVIFSLRCILVVWMLYLGGNIIDIVIIDTLVNCLHALFKVYYVFITVKLRPKFIKPAKRDLIELFIYTSYIALNVIVNQINWRVDNFILGVMTSSKTVGVFNIGSQLTMSFIAFSSAVSNIFVPKLMKMVTQGATSSTLTDELIVIGRMQLFVLGFVFAAFVCFGSLFIELFVGSEFKQAYWVTLIPLIPFTIVLVQSSSNAILQAMNKHKIRALILLATAIFNVILSIILVHYYGMLGAVTATAVTLFIGEVILVNIYLARVIKLEIGRFIRHVYLVSVLPISLTIVAGYYVRDYFNATWFGLIAGCAVLMLLYGVLLYLITLNTIEKQFIANGLLRIKTTK